MATLTKKESEAFLQKMVETEKRPRTRKEKKLLKDVEKASKIVLIKDTKLFNELHKKDSDNPSNMEVIIQKDITKINPLSGSTKAMLEQEIKEYLRNKQLLFYNIGDETIDGWLTQANVKIIRSFQEGRKEAVEEFSERLMKMIPSCAYSDFQIKYIYNEVDKIKKEMLKE